MFNQLWQDDGKTVPSTPGGSTMNMSGDLRASARIPTTNRVKIITNSRGAFYALTINIGMKGLLLSASPALPVGSPCKLAILPSGHEDGKRILVEGTVIRNDTHGTAVRFLKDLENGTYAALAKQETLGVGSSIFNAYYNYFKVSQNKHHEGSEELLGVSARTFRAVFLTSFCTCIPLAIFPVWLLRDSIPSAPVWLKITASFGYAAIWLAIIQPSVDLMTFKYLRYKKKNS